MSEIIKVDTIQIKRGLSNSVEQEVLLDGELAYKKDTNRLAIGDGVTPGGVEISCDSYSNNQKRTFNYRFFFKGNVYAGTWAGALLAGASVGYTGSSNGYVSSNPLNILFPSRIIKLYVNFRTIEFVTRTTPGNVFLDLGFLDHIYNATMNERILRFEIEGSFVGSSAVDIAYRKETTSITNIYKENFFRSGELIGIILRSDVSVPGLITRIRDAYFDLVFEEIT